MAQTWPATVPTSVIHGSFRESPPDNTLRSPMDVGPDKVRRRSTSEPRPLGWDSQMTTAQVATFDTFYNTTLVSGTLTFNFPHPRTTVSSEMRYTQPPQYTPVGDGQWMVSMQVEIMP